MWIVNIALRRPYTFIVMALLILLSTPLVLSQMATDIFPDINIPVVSIVWNYSGLSAQDMGQRITATNERSLTTTVNDIEHVESQSLAGVAVIKVFFQPNANIQTAIAQVVAIEQAQLRALPPGITPPLIIKYSASSIPVIQLGISSPSMTEQALSDTALNFLRPQLVTVPGAAIPYPYGGKSRVVSVDLDNQAMLAKGLTSTDIVNAISAQNLTLPSGTAKMGETEYNVSMNGSPDTIAGLNSVPVLAKNGVVTNLSEVAHVRDGFSPQTNIVRQDGQRGVLISILKNGNASTLDVVGALRKLLPTALQSLPKEFNVKPLFDQSVFVRAAITGVIHEAIIAACLTALMILLFLGNWRSTCIIAVSIPLSILASILALFMIGETINIMTLGGLALAVGILVDDATVTIENIERHLHLGSDLNTAILDGAGEIAIPALVSTLCICIVFVPMFFLTGVARYLFVPLAEAVVFAMIASYVLSRTLVPTMVMMMMSGAHTSATDKPSLLQRVYKRFDAGFERFRGGYVIILSKLITHRKMFGSVFLLFCVLSLGLVFALGRDFFPSVDSGQIRLHMRAPTGMRIEETARLADQVEKVIREIIPADELETILDNLGVPYSGLNLSYSNAGTIGTMDGEILLSLNEHHKASSLYIEKLRQVLPQRFPGVEFFFQPADIVTQILNFGLSAAIDVQISGANLAGNYQTASHLMKQVKQIPGAVDVHILQKLNQPTLALTMDRTHIKQLGLNPVDLAQNLLVSLSGSFQTAPAFWLNPLNGVVYNIAVQTPQYQIADMDSLLRTPVKVPNDPAIAPQLLSNLVQVAPAEQMADVSHYNIQPVIDLYVSVEGRDLGAVATQVEKLVDQVQPGLARGTHIVIRGQVQTMKSSFWGLGIGLLMAIVLVYLLIVVNFQSWVDPFIIITALPAALAGIVWMLFLTGTNLSVPALTGAIMTMGVATANSILMVSFARQRMLDGLPPLSAALEAGATRIRPVLMTALAMIIGMIPMAIGFGEGAEQNAPLGRAVIGGLLFATVSTLFFVPIVFAGIHRYLEKKKPHGDNHGPSHPVVTSPEVLP